MTAMRIVGIVLVLLGIAGYFTGGLSFNQETTQAQLGPLKLQVQEKKTVEIPLWLSLGAVALGGVILLASLRRG
ncbi:MAG: hypothetical protein NDJ19_11170 [Ramlibacter sp.]|nr:hypothetical protein [Ramlibacter sp.]